MLLSWLSSAFRKGSCSPTVVTASTLDYSEQTALLKQTALCSSCLKVAGPAIPVPVKTSELRDMVNAKAGLRRRRIEVAAVRVLGGIGIDGGGGGHTSGIDCFANKN